MPLTILMLYKTFYIKFFRLQYNFYFVADLISAGIKKLMVNTVGQCDMFPCHVALLQNIGIYYIGICKDV